MLNSRNIQDLNPKVGALAESLIKACKENGIDIIVTSTYRDNESQQALYNQGRTPESKAKKEYRKQREEVRDDFRSIVTEEFDNKEDVKVILDGLMEETVGIKDKNLSYEETLELLNENGKLDTKDTKEKIVKKLRENGNTNEEIEEKMNKIYSNLNR